MLLRKVMGSFKENSRERTESGSLFRDQWRIDCALSTHPQDEERPWSCKSP